MCVLRVSTKCIVLTVSKRQSNCKPYGNGANGFWSINFMCI